MKEKIRRIRGGAEYPEEQIRKTVSISYDGNQYLVRIPKKISDLFHLTKKSKLNFIVDVPSVVDKHEQIMVVEIVEEEK